MARRRPKHVDVDKPRGYSKMKLRRWERRKAKIRPADTETYQIQADSPEGH